MKKAEKDYLEKYGDIPISYEERQEFLEKSIRSYAKRIEPFLEKEINRIKSIKWKTLSYTIYIIPKGTPRPRLGMHNVFYVRGAKENHDLFESIVKDEDIPLIRTPVKFSCDSYLPIPKSMLNIEKVLAEMKLIRPISTPDWDNLGKAYCDMLQGILIYDDSLVIEGVSRKFYSIKPRVEITIRYMEEAESSFNKKKIERQVQ